MIQIKWSRPVIGLGGILEKVGCGREENMDKGVRTFLIVGSVVVAVLILVAAVFWLASGWGGGYRSGYGYGMMGPGMMWGFGGMWFMPIIMIVLWGLVIWGIVALVRGGSSSGNRGTSTYDDSALEILKRRYARGEVTKQEFEERKKDLELSEFQYKELEGANLTIGEEKNLEEEILILSNAERLRNTTRNMYDKLYGSEFTLYNEIHSIKKDH